MRLMDAIKDLNQSLELNPLYVKAYFRRGVVSFSLKNFENAKRDFEKAKELEPRNYSFLLSL